MGNCPNCGKEINEGVKFCPSCGNKTEPEQQQQAVPPPAQQPVAHAASPPAAVQEPAGPKVKKPGDRKRLADRIERLVREAGSSRRAVVMCFTVMMALILVLLMRAGVKPQMPRLDYEDVNRAINISGGIDEVRKVDNLEMATEVEKKYGGEIESIVQSSGVPDPEEKYRYIMDTIVGLRREDQGKFVKRLGDVVRRAARDNPGQVDEYLDAYMQLFEKESEVAMERAVAGRTTQIKFLVGLGTFLVLFMGLAATLALMRMDANMQRVTETLERGKNE